MDKQQARKIIKETFENPFDKGRYTGFIKNLLNHIEEGSFTYQGNYIPDAYKQYIKSLDKHLKKVQKWLRENKDKRGSKNSIIKSNITDIYFFAVVYKHFYF